MHLDEFLQAYTLCITSLLFVDNCKYFIWSRSRAFDALFRPYVGRRLASSRIVPSLLAVPTICCICCLLLFSIAVVVVVVCHVNDSWEDAAACSRRQNVHTYQQQGEK